jgi:hypothetical protein
MNANQATKEAAKQSKDGSVRFVVWVYDQGREICDAEQVRIYAKFMQIEAVYLGGVQIAHEAAHLA